MGGWDAPRREARNERIFRQYLESVACNAYVGRRPQRGRSAVALAEDLFVRPVPARATLYARRWPEMAGKARTRRWALETIRLSDGWDARSISRVESRGVDRIAPHRRRSRELRPILPRVHLGCAGACGVRPRGSPSRYRSGPPVAPGRGCRAGRGTRRPHSVRALNPNQ